MFNTTETTRQIVNTLLPDLGAGCSADIARVDELSTLISRQLSRAPFYIYLVMTILTWLFNVFPIFKWGGTFSALSKERRKVQVLGWKVSPLKIKRDFINFFESFIILGLYETCSPAGNAMNAGAGKTDPQPGTGTPA